MSLSEKITTETLRKIASNEEYDENEILCVAEYLTDLYEYDFQRHFGLVTTEDPSKSHALDRLKNVDVKEEAFFIVYNKGVKHWVCLAITYLYNSVIILYKDSLGVPIPDNLREAIGNCLKTERVRFESHRGTEQSDESSSGPICLRNLQVLLKGLKSDVIKVPLIEKFQKVRFCTQYGVQSVKREFRLWLQKYLLSGLEEISTELVQDEHYEDFKKYLISFLDACAKVLQETYLLSSNYTSLLKTEAKKKDQDPTYETDQKTVRALKDAKDKFYKNPQVQKSLKFDKNDFIDIEDGHRVYNLDIQERYPVQMQKFTKIFAVLAQAEMNEELETALQVVSRMLGLEFSMIKLFFDQNKTPRRPQFMRADFTPPNINAGIAKAVEAVKSKSKTVKDSVKVDSKDKKIKDWDRLLSELILDAQHPNDNSSESAESAAQIEELRESLPKIQEYYSTWSTRGLPEITMFSNACKAEEKIFDTDQIYEAIAVLDRANELATGGQRLRAPQILSVLVFLKSTASYHGKLCQIESGEGKTVIVSLLATMMILQGEKSVDVITSNAVLAQEGIDSRKLFYSMFGISIATNAPDKTYSQGPRKCYLADVVYGSISDFQFDYLRDTAEGLGTLSGRQFGRVILDEVDNMLVDNGRHIAKISSPFPGMENLKYIYIKIWCELLKVESELVDDFQEKLNEFSDLTKAKEMAITEFIKIFDASMIGRIEERIKTNLKDLDFKFVPTHCLKYAESMIPKWIGNAIRARYFINENEQYSIKETNGEFAIVPVDYSNTGVTLKNTVWSYGLHQFVQIKHNLRITPESLTNSCVSNYAYIGKYGNKIFGLTGTLGSKAEQDLLSSIYNIDYARIPSYKTKIFKELKGVAVADDEWSCEVALMTVGLVRSTGRAVLIICKTISDLLLLEEQFKIMDELSLENCKIKLKKFQDEETADVTREVVSSGDVIVATNIAGRGADFKTSKELEKNGGLHVCVGFCPDNERVREQAFFRTSRQGNAGSAQLVVRESEIKKLHIDTSNLNEIDFDEVKRRIDIIERERLSDIKFSKVDVLRYEDAVFSLFSDFCQELKNNNVITWGHSYSMKDLKEFWAFWLEDQNFEGKKFSLKEASFIFYKFKNHEKTRRIVDGSITQNPYYGVLQADFFLKNDEVEKAKASLINAICLSKNANVMFPAFLTLFDSTLEDKGPLLLKFRSFLGKVFSSDHQNNEKIQNFSTEILEYLTISLAGLSQEISFMENYYFNDEYNDDFKLVLVKPSKGKDNLLIKHLAAKLTCLKVYRSNIETLLEALEGSDTHKLCISKRITDYLKNFKPDTKEEKQTKELMTEQELSELGSKGMKTVYGVKKIASVSDSDLEKAKTQILGGLTLIARATAFPPLTFAVANIVSCMIAEAIALVVLTFFKETNNIDDMLHKVEYLKGKSLNYIVSLMVSGALNYEVCIKIFLRMVRCYRESYYLLEHSNDNVRLLKSVNSTQISKDVKAVENYNDYGTTGLTKKVYVPETLATCFFESEVRNTIIASLVHFIVDKKSDDIEKGKDAKDKTKAKNPSKNASFIQASENLQSISKIESYLSSALPNKFGGAYDELCNQFSNGKDFVVVNLVPFEMCYKDTPYSAISKSQMPAIVMLDRDYRGLQKLRCDVGSVIEFDKKKDKYSKTYSKLQQELLGKGEFWAALKYEIADILAVSKFYELNLQEFANYTTPIIQMLQYCKETIFPGVPNGYLASSEQCIEILKQFKLKHEAF